jgi:3'-phosphoadenosine 5'-phosphosulfate sulfotransferase (PAPS reductase)/FAD synthetase
MNEETRDKITQDEYRILVSLPKDIKRAKTKLRINEAIDKFGADGLYVSISGGNDSHALHLLVAEVEMERWGKLKIPRVFCDTGLEYPEVREVALSIANVVIRPKMTHTEVIKKYGYPVVSKEQSLFIDQYRNTNSEKQKHLRWYGNINKVGKISEKWKYLINTDIPISNRCCWVIKKYPFMAYNKETGRIPIIGTRATESDSRKRKYLKNGCNSFSCEKHKMKSAPLSPWANSDILEYLVDRGAKIPSVYGEIIEVIENGVIHFETTELDSTGCMFCLYGIQFDGVPNRIQRMATTHPKQYDYCVRGGTYNELGYFVPKNGLGLSYVMDILNMPWKPLN